jgi:hypothetical protein
MTSSYTASADHIAASAFYHRDRTVPFWRLNADVEALFVAHSHHPGRAQAWLRYRNVSETCLGFRSAKMMRGHFEGGILGNHLYHWTFTPIHSGDLAIVMPVFHDHRLVDFVAMSRHDHTLWGCCTGAGHYLGLITTPLRVYRTPANWLANECRGILPLSKVYLPLLRNAPNIIAEDDEHAWDLTYRVFIDPAAGFGANQGDAEELAYDRIEVRP